MFLSISTDAKPATLDTVLGVVCLNRTQFSSVVFFITEHPRISPLLRIQYFQQSLYILFPRMCGRTTTQRLTNETHSLILNKHEIRNALSKVIYFSYLPVTRPAITLKHVQFNKIWTHLISVNFRHNSNPFFA